MDQFTIGFASDHAGIDLKLALIEHALSKGYAIKDFGCYTHESCDYPDYAHPLAEAVLGGECRFGFALCSTANGVNMTLNRHKGIRSAICWNTKIAALARQHNDANICAMPANYLSIEEGTAIFDTFLAEQFQGGRHLRRVEKIEIPE